MIKVGIAGIGFMGVTHFAAWAKVPDAQVTALCTRSGKKLDGDWSDVQGNFGGSGGVHDFSDLARYSDYEQLVNDPSVNVIDVCLPTHLHVSATIAALEAGKHVVVEKPIALNVQDSQRMVEAAQSNGRLLFVAQVLRFSPEWVFLKDALESGEFGKLSVLNLRRIISVPRWSDEIADLAALGGPLIDLHIHDADFLLFLLGKPRSVFASGVERDGVILYTATTYDYANGPRVTCQSGAVAAEGRPFKHEFEACFEDATVCYAGATERTEPDAAAGQSSSQVLTVYRKNGSATYPTLKSSDGFHQQLSHVANCIRADRPSTVIGPESARDALALVIREGESIRSGTTQSV